LKGFNSNAEDYAQNFMAGYDWILYPFIILMQLNCFSGSIWYPFEESLCQGYGKEWL